MTQMFPAIAQHIKRTLTRVEMSHILVQFFEQLFELSQVEQK
jgi:hypothetical protein